MSVLRLKDQSKWSDLKLKRGANAIVPVYDGNGDLIISKEVLNDPAFSDIAAQIASVTEEIAYVDLTEAKLATLESQGKINKEVTADVKAAEQQAAFEG